MTYKDIFEKFKNETVCFSSYYKYSFTFKNENISCGIGGSSDEIYRLEIDANKPLTVGEIGPRWIHVLQEKKTYYDEENIL